MRATLDAIRQAATMVIINAQEPSVNYTPSSAAQVFVTNARLSELGVVDSTKKAGTAAAPAAARTALASAKPVPPRPHHVVRVNVT
jgi:hypothetical protein